MVSSTLCPAVHILGSQNVYGKAEGIADHYWPWPVFFMIKGFGLLVLQNQYRCKLPRVLVCTITNHVRITVVC